MSLTNMFKFACMMCIPEVRRDEEVAAAHPPFGQGTHWQKHGSTAQKLRKRTHVTHTCTHAPKHSVRPLGTLLALHHPLAAAEPLNCRAAELPHSSPPHVRTRTSGTCRRPPATKTPLVVCVFGLSKHLGPTSHRPPDTAH